MRLGFHCSVGKGLKNTIEEAVALKCETIQIFSRSPRSWYRREFDKKELAEFKKSLKEKNLYPLVVHMLYLPNLASCDKKLYKKSVDVLIDELKRCRILGAQYLVIHPGRYSTGDFETGIKNIIAAINFAFSKVPSGRSEEMLLLENLAGGKTDIGWRFEELRRIIDNIKEKNRIGVCLDTCHLFAAGYEISENGFDKTVNEFDKVVGLDYLKLLHLNDSKNGIGSKIDRHTHIGAGDIGLEGFRAVVNHPKIKNLPGILETPQNNLTDNTENIKKLRDLAK